MPNKLLAARDERQRALNLILAARPRAIVFLSLNIPGRDKTPPGSRALHAWALEQLLTCFSGCRVLHEGDDALGCFSLLAVEADPQGVKAQCLALEASSAPARLLDLDVYDSSGVQVGRAALGVAARPCLLCERTAVDCMREKRHLIDDVVGKTHELLAQFNA